MASIEKVFLIDNFVINVIMLFVKWLNQCYKKANLYNLFSKSMIVITSVLIQTNIQFQCLNS